MVREVSVKGDAQEMADTLVETPLLRGLTPGALRTIERQLYQGLRADPRFRDTVKRITLTKDMLLPETKLTGGPYTVVTSLGAFPARFGRGPLVVRKLTEMLVDNHIVSVVEFTRKPLFLADAPLLPTTPAFKRREIELQQIAYSIYSRRHPHRHVTLSVPMAEGPDRTLYYMPGSIHPSVPLIRSDERWLERMSRRLAKIRIETIWRKWQAKRLSVAVST